MKNLSLHTSYSNRIKIYLIVSYAQGLFVVPTRPSRAELQHCRKLPVIKFSVPAYRLPFIDMSGTWKIIAIEEDHLRNARRRVAVCLLLIPVKTKWSQIHY